MTLSSRRCAGKSAGEPIDADYRWGPNGEARPTFSVDELRLIAETASASGRPVAAHATTDEGMRRAIAAGVDTIEHGDAGSLETYRLMARESVAICPTLGAVEAISRYRGWDGTPDAAPARIRVKRAQMERVLRAGAPVCMGSDVGVFDHGDNAWELELMVDYGMEPLAVLTAATSGNARILGLDGEIGRVAPGYVADLIAVEGDPTTDVSMLTSVAFAMHGGAATRWSGRPRSSARP